MYVSENIMTLEAINSTVREVISPTGSRIIGKVIRELLIKAISHWMSTVFCVIVNMIVTGVIRKVISHRVNVKGFVWFRVNNMD